MSLKNQSTNNSESNLKEENFDLNFKLVILGNQGVGKTCFLIQYTQHSFTAGTQSTQGLDFAFESVVRTDKRIKLKIMDTGKVFLLAFVVILPCFCCQYCMITCLSLLQKIT